MVKKIIAKVEAKLSTDVDKASLGDYIKLVQLEKDLADEGPREIKVTWIDPSEK